MAQLAQRLRLDLPDAFARNLEALSYLFQRMLRAVFQPEAHLDHPFLARCQRAQNLRGVLLQVHADDRLARRNRLPVFDEVAEVRIFLFADRCLERDGFLRNLQNLAYLRHRNIHAPRDLFAARLAAQLLDQLTGRADEFVDRLDHVHRDADRSCLVRNRARNRLAYPPRRVRRELVAAAVLEFVHRLHQADVAFLNQVEKLQSAVGVLLRDRHNESEVRLDQLALRLLGVHVALDHLALGALQLRNRDTRIDLDLLEIDLAILLLAAILLFQFLALRSLVLLIQRTNLPLERAHRVDSLVHLVEQPLAFQARVLQLTHDARHIHLLARNQPAQLAKLLLAGFAVCCFLLLFELRNLLLVLYQLIDTRNSRAHARQHHLFSQLFFAA